jgi:saccharopine dehydrogenase-like NADP-dependent oxidoreductase
VSSSRGNSLLRNQRIGGTPMRIVIIGAYGQFGRRIASELARDASLAIVVAGRSPDAAGRLAASLREQFPATQVTPATLDVEAPDLASRLAHLCPGLVIHAAGPFQARDYRVAEAALGCGAHYESE